MLEIKLFNLNLNLNFYLLNLSQCLSMSLSLLIKDWSSSWLQNIVWIVWFWPNWWSNDCRFTLYLISFVAIDCWTSTDTLVHWGMLWEFPCLASLASSSSLNFSYDSTSWSTVWLLTLWWSKRLLRSLTSVECCAATNNVLETAKSACLASRATGDS